MATNKELAPTNPQKPEEKAETGENIAGVMGNHKDVVFILEGDKESATYPELRIGTATAPTGELAAPRPEESLTKPEEAGTRPTEATAKPEEAATKPIEASTKPREAATKPTEVATKREAAHEVKIDAAEVKVAEAGAAETGKAPDTAEKAGSAAAANAETLAKPETAKAEANPGSAQWEVTARTPIIRTSEKQGNEGNNPSFSGKGDLSPLENENETAPVTGHKGKTFTDTVATVRNAAEGVQETVNNAPTPLAEGLRPEQFRADQQMREATLNAPVKAGNLFNEMVSRIESMNTESTQAMTIQLKPEFLGKVALEIAMDATGLHVKISAVDGGVRAMINGQIAALIESLENKGIDVAKVEVAYTGVDNGAFKENREGQAQQNQRRRTTREIDSADGITYYTALPFDTLEYYLDAGVSSVEYRA